MNNPFRRTVTIIARVPRGEQVAASTPATAALNRRVVLVPVTGGEVESRDRRIAYWLTGVSAVVLLIGLANATTLLLVRAAKRRRETAIRAALGASRGRLLSHIAIESLLVGLCAAAASLVLAYWIDEAVRRVLLPGIVERDRADMRSILGAAAAGLVAALLATAAGAAHFVRGGSMAAFSVAQGFSPAHAGFPIRKALLVVQTTMSVLLLAGAGMFGRSLHTLLSQDFGTRMDDVLVADFEQGGAPVRGASQIFGAALERVRVLPGVQAATMYGALPFTGFHVPPIAVPGKPHPNVDGQPPFLIAATPALFAILDITIVDGRTLTPQDDRGAPVVLVNETMARGVWPGERAVGKCIRIGFDPDFDPSTAVRAGDAVRCAAVP